MKTPWYMPKTGEIWLLSGGGDPRYYRWFDTLKDAKSYSTWRRSHDEKVPPTLRLVWRDKGRLPISFGQPVGWVLFDADNGDASSKRYCWLFCTRKEARIMHAQHKGSSNLTRLVGPFQVGY